MTGKELEDAYGGVVFDTEGRVLLREPSGHYDGFVWTFSKGRPQAGETPGETALRETQEETGVSAEIIKQIPGAFRGGWTVNVYFLMRPSGSPGKPRGETRSVRWVTPDNARELIKKTTNPVGRKRDLEVLEAALRLRRALRHKG